MNIPFYGTKMKLNEKKLKDFLYIAFPILLMALCAIFLMVLFIKQDQTMQRLHCKKTGRSESYSYIQYTYGQNGQVTGVYPMGSEQFEYQCENRIVWR